MALIITINTWWIKMVYARTLYLCWVLMSSQHCNGAPTCHKPAMPFKKILFSAALNNIKMESNHQCFVRTAYVTGNVGVPVAS